MSRGKRAWRRQSRGPPLSRGPAWRDRIALGARFPLSPNVPHSSLSRWLPSIIAALTSKNERGGGGYVFLKPTSGNACHYFVCTPLTTPGRHMGAAAWETALGVRGGRVAPQALAIHYKKQALRRDTHRYCPRCAYRGSEHLPRYFSSAAKHFVLKRLQDTDRAEPSTKSHFAPR